MQAKVSFFLPLIFFIIYIPYCTWSGHLTVFCLAHLNPAVWLSVTYIFFGLEVFQLQKFPFQKFSTLRWLAGKKPQSFQVAPVKILTGATVFWPLFPLLFLFLIQCNLNMHSNKPKTNFKIEPKKHISGLESNSHWN